MNSIGILGPNQYPTIAYEKWDKQNVNETDIPDDITERRKNSRLTTFPHTDEGLTSATYIACPIAENQIIHPTYSLQSRKRSGIGEIAAETIKINRTWLIHIIRIILNI